MGLDPILHLLIWLFCWLFFLSFFLSFLLIFLKCLFFFFLSFFPSFVFFHPPFNTQVLASFRTRTRASFLSVLQFSSSSERLEKLCPQRERHRHHEKVRTRPRTVSTAAAAAAADCLWLSLACSWLSVCCAAGVWESEGDVLGVCRPISSQFLRDGGEAALPPLRTHSEGPHVAQGHEGTSAFTTVCLLTVSKVWATNCSEALSCFMATESTEEQQHWLN